MIEEIEVFTIEELKFLCIENIKRGGSAVIYLDLKRVLLDGQLLSFDEATKKLIKELNLYSHKRS